MSMFIDSHSRLGHTHEQHLAVKCPHCQVMSHITPVSTPAYAQLLRYKPKYVGIVYRCDSCNSPVFLKFPVKAYGSDRVELSTSYSEIEKAKEKFSYMYLPEKTEALFKEALTCYSNSCPNAFASMCRRTAQMIFHDLGDAGKLKIFDLFNEARDMAEIDDETFVVLKKIVFDSEGNVPELNAAQVGVLLEMMKDMLYQCYVRKGKLQQAVMVRRYFIEESESNITRLKS